MAKENDPKLKDFKNYNTEIVLEKWAEPAKKKRLGTQRPQCRQRRIHTAILRGA